jgi:hypothetical protein
VNGARRFLAGGPFGRSKTAAARLRNEATVHHRPDGLILNSESHTLAKLILRLIRGH